MTSPPSDEAIKSGGLPLLSISMAQYQRTTKEMTPAPELKHEFATADDNWGNCYCDLDRKQLGIHGCDEFNRLEPRFALAYSNPFWLVHT